MCATIIVTYFFMSLNRKISIFPRTWRQSSSTGWWASRSKCIFKFAIQRWLRLPEISRKLFWYWRKILAQGFRWRTSPGYRWRCVLFSTSFFLLMLEIAFLDYLYPYYYYLYGIYIYIYKITYMDYFIQDFRWLMW